MLSTEVNTKTDRSAQIKRQTLETNIHLTLTLDGQGEFHAQTGMPFFEHMLHQFVRHSRLDLTLNCDGDLAIDDHHSVEDIGIVLGQAISLALADKKGISRFGSAYVPLDEALSRVVVDLSGRAGLFFQPSFTRDYIHHFDTQLVAEFFQALVNHAQFTLHIDNLKGVNAHHQVESIFKAFGVAFRQAIKYDSQRSNQIASTKGLL